MTAIGVVIADDDPQMRSSLKLLVDDAPDMEVLATAADGQEAVQAIIELQPDVALLDIRMPRMSGLEAAKQLTASGIRTRLIVLTTFDVDDYVYAALQAGASGFLLKNSSLPEILRSIRVAHEGNALLAPEVTRRLVGAFAAKTKAQHRLIEPLTDRERETLILIGKGASNNEIAAGLFVTPTTVRTYVSRILTKLGARDRAQLVVIAYESGLISTSTP